MEQKRLPVFAERFAELRVGMTQGEFADFIGISRPTVGFYENGTRLPDALVLRQIAEKCNVATDWLIGLTDVKELRGELQQICDYTGLSAESAKRLHYERTSKYGPKEVLLLINKILGTPILHFKDYLWRYAMATIQTDKSMKIPKKQEELRAIAEERDMKMYRAALGEPDAVSWSIEISAADAARLYKQRAISPLEGAISSTISEYLWEMEALLEQIRAKSDESRDENVELSSGNTHIADSTKDRTEQ